MFHTQVLLCVAAPVLSCPATHGTRREPLVANCSDICSGRLSRYVDPPAGTELQTSQASCAATGDNQIVCPDGGYARSYLSVAAAATAAAAKAAAAACASLTLCGGLLGQEHRGHVHVGTAALCHVRRRRRCGQSPDSRALERYARRLLQVRPSSSTRALQQPPGCRGRLTSRPLLLLLLLTASAARPLVLVASSPLAGLSTSRSCSIR